MGNVFLVFLKLGQKHCVFSVFETSGGSYLCIVFLVFLKLGQKHSVFCVFGDPDQCFSHLGFLYLTYFRGSAVVDCDCRPGVPEMYVYSITLSYNIKPMIKNRII